MLINDYKYMEVIKDIKSYILTSRHNVFLSANKELICLYWKIGTMINANSSWGNKLIENLATDIKLEFPNAKGFSVRNLKYMAKFAKDYLDYEFVQTVSAQITWSHNVFLIDKVKDVKKRKWYNEKIIENGWSLNTLRHQLEHQLYERQAIPQKTSNFEKQLESPQKELAIEVLKDPYIFDFIDLTESMRETDIEKELIKNITKLLLELGRGFSFVGHQYHIKIGNKDYYIDMLFYNITLQCYVVVELKMGEFKPEYAGKINFYLSAIDDLLKTDFQKPSIGILLCKEKDNFIVEYALKDMTKPIGVSEYQLTSALPMELENFLPDAQDISSRVFLNPMKKEIKFFGEAEIEAN